MQFRQKVTVAAGTALLIGNLLAASAIAEGTDTLPTISAKTDLVTLISDERLHIGTSFAKAEATNKAALAQAQQTQGEAEYAQLLNDGALIELLQNKTAASTLHAQQSLTSRERVYGVKGDLVADSLNTLALVALSNKDYSGVENQANAALLIENENSEKNALRIADTYGVLANKAIDLGDLQTAERYAKQSLEIHQKSVGSSNAATARDWFTLATIALCQGETAKAKELYTQCLQNADNIQRPGALLALASVNLFLGQMAESERYYSQFVSFSEMQSGAEDPAILGERGLYIKALWDHQRWLDSMELRHELRIATSATGTLSTEGRLLQRAFQAPQAKSYDGQNIALCLLFALVPLSLIALMFVFRKLMAVPSGHGFNEFVANHPIKSAEKAPTKDTRNVSPIGRLSLRNLRDDEYSKSKSKK